MNPIDFIHRCLWDDLPVAVQAQTRRCLLDTLGAAIGGRQTAASRIIHEIAVEQFSGRGGRLWLDGREVSPAGAALAGAMTTDALDIHDGRSLNKGHGGAGVVPAVVVAAGLAGRISLGEVLTLTAVGYEIALRAGQALHATAAAYHTSGAWNALGAAAVLARHLRLSPDQTRHALGIAEYYGPRSPMMRCIDHPAMIKDGSGWGAHAGVTAAFLARRGFTGAPAVTVEVAEPALWATLGTDWFILDQYFKPDAVCRWAQPAMAAARVLRKAHAFKPDEIVGARVFTFHEATRLTCRRPRATDEAQYSLPFPLASALVHGRLGWRELTGQGLADERVLALSDRIELIEEEAFNRVFPAQRLARVELVLTDGRRLVAGPVTPAWEADSPPTDAELWAKFRWLADGALPVERAEALLRLIRDDPAADAAVLQDLLAPPVAAGEVQP